MKLLIFVSIIFLSSSIYGQQKVLTINIDEIQNRKKSLIIDSVHMDSKPLLKLDTSKNNYIIPEMILTQDSRIPLSIFIKEKEYTIWLHKEFLTYCTIYHNISLYYHKHILYVHLSDCTSIQLIGPAEVNKIKR